MQASRYPGGADLSADELRGGGGSDAAANRRGAGSNQRGSGRVPSSDAPTGTDRLRDTSMNYGR